MEARDYVLALKQNGMTQVQIEERTGIPQPTISKIERGDVADVMSKTYRALKATYDEIMDVERAPEVPQATADIAMPATAVEQGA